MSAPGAKDPERTSLLLDPARPALAPASGSREPIGS